MPAILDGKTFEPILFDMALADQLMLPAKPLAVRTRQTLEEIGQHFLIARTHGEMPVVGHELIGVDRKWKLLMRSLNECLKPYIVGVRA